MQVQDILFKHKGNLKMKLTENQKKTIKSKLRPIIESILNEEKSYPLKYISRRDYEKYNLEDFPNFSASGSITGMKKQYYGKSAKLVKCGSYIYNVSRRPEIYDVASITPI